MRSIAVTIYTKVFVTDEEVAAFREEAIASGEPYDNDEDAIYALSIAKIDLPDDVKIIDILPDPEQIQ